MKKTISNRLVYRGYLGSIEADLEDRCLYGTVQGIRDVVHYQGQTVEEVIQAFHDSVDDYLEMCRERGINPEKSAEMIAGTIGQRSAKAAG